MADLTFGSVSGQTFTGGTVSGQSYSQPAAGDDFSPATMADVVAYWDAGDTTTLIKGGVDLVPADDDFYARTGALPLVSSGTPQYPISVVCWFKPDTTSSAHRLLSLSDGTGTELLEIYRQGATAGIRSLTSGGSSAIFTAASSVTASRWHCAVGVWGAANARAIYLDTDTTGATNGTSRAVTTIDNLHVGRMFDGTEEWDGVIAYTAVLPVDLSGAGNATKRENIFKGYDPEGQAGVTATALWRFDNDAGADSRGSFDLTASGTPTAQNNLIVLRDQVGTYHQRATTSAPTWDSTLFSNRGGAVFTAASSQFLVCESTPITAAPFQVYAVAQAANVTAGHTVWWLGDKDSPSEFWELFLAGAVALDPLQFNAIDGTTVTAGTSTSFSASTTHLLWGLETSSASRAVRLDGAGEGTNTDDRSPDGADRLGLGMRLDSTPNLPHDGSLGAVWLLNSADVTERADAHDWVDAEFGTEIP